MFSSRHISRTVSAAKRVGQRVHASSATAAKNVDLGFSWRAALVGGVGSAAVMTLGGATLAFASGDEIHPPHLPWFQNSYFHGFDHAALRRGFQVYKEVCAACHSLSYIRYREMDGVMFSTDEIKSMAAEDTIEDLDDKGNVILRPRIPGDVLPAPYPNEKAARAANNGAYPPDLSLVTKARHGGSDYIFAILTGYKEEIPPGVELGEGQEYNPYFPGGAISMPKPLSDERVEYPDGTPATETQLAKDVTVFLEWASEPFFEERKQTGIKTVGTMAILTLLSGYHKRFTWMALKTRRSYAVPRRFR